MDISFVNDRVVFQLRDVKRTRNSPTTCKSATALVSHYRGLTPAVDWTMRRWRAVAALRGLTWTVDSPVPQSQSATVITMAAQRHRGLLFWMDGNGKPEPSQLLKGLKMPSLFMDFGSKSQMWTEM